MMSQRKGPIDIMLLLFLVTLWPIVSAQPTRVFSLADRCVNVVPYYSQGSKPWCAVAVAAMIIAYAKYPAQPPTLERLASEMGTKKDGTGIGEFLGAMHSRGIETETLVSYSPHLVKHSLADGYPVFAVTKVERIEKQFDWWWGIWVEVRVIFMHAMLMVGYDGEKVLVHDPATVPLRELTDRQFEKDWAYGYVIKAKPGESPCYTVRVNFIGAMFPVQVLVDGEPRSGFEFRFEVGTSHELKVTPVLTKYENRTHRVTYTCDRNAPIILKQWTTDLCILNYTYGRTIDYRVRILHPAEPQDLWVRHGGFLTVSPVDRSLPAESALGFLGFNRVFRGWYEDGQLLSRSLDLAITVTKPLEVEPRWELDILEGPGIWVLGTVSATAPLVAILVRDIALSRTRRNKRNACHLEITLDDLDSRNAYSLVFSPRTLNIEWSKSANVRLDR